MRTISLLLFLMSMALGTRAALETRLLMYQAAAVLPS